MRASPYLQPIGEDMALVPLELAPGVKPEEIHFGELSYCREALYRAGRRRGPGQPGERHRRGRRTPAGLRPYAGARRAGRRRLF